MAEPAEKAEETEPFRQKEEVEFHPANLKAEREEPEDQRIRIRVIILVVAVLVLVGVAFAVGYVVRMVLHTCDNPAPSIDLDQLVQEATENISTSNIEDQLRYFTGTPHVGGSIESKEQAQYIQKEWRNNGLDAVELKKYDVVLSFPKKPGLARILDVNGAENFRASQKHKAIVDGEKNDKLLPPFNAFSRSGNVTAPLVFVNYARLEDFKKLKALGISVAGHIVIAKYGKNFRGDKERLARAEGAVGLILYTDPKDYSPGVSANHTYPKTWWLPSTGVQSGTLFVGDGDLATPGYPSIDGMYRETINETHDQLPKLPVYPVSSEDAKRFLQLLTKTKAPKDWQGGLPMTYYINMTTSDKRKVNLQVEMELVTKTVYNVMGILKGCTEPDRMVIFGSHRDAWAFGATDPSSGLVVLMETVRVIGRMRKEKNWCPRRTMVFMSWGGEEHGGIGSCEWMEDFTNLIENRAVAYLNVDTAVEGNYTFRMDSSPLMDFAMFEATKKVFTPNGSVMDFVYHDWKVKRPDKTDPSIPQTGRITLGGDYKHFYHRLGIPCIDFGYIWDTSKMNISSYPVYHTVHDTFHWVSNFVDQGFHYHRTVAQVWVRLGVLLTESLIIPFNCSRYAERMESHVKELKKVYGKELKDKNIKLDQLEYAVKNLTATAKEFQRFLSASKLTNDQVYSVRAANDRLMQFEKSFINPQGIPGKPFRRHMIYAPNAVDKYSGLSFPGVADSIYEAKTGKGDWNQVRKQLSLLVYYIRSANQIINTGSNI